MGTHPIFESDFDCLTEMIDKNGTHGLNGGLVTSYLVAHLATFPVEGVKTEHVVAEAEKKLKHYEAKERLWPQNLVMRVDEYHLQLETPDEEPGKGAEIVEKIPISAVQLCSTAADLQKQKEILLILTKPSAGAELYCFTCLATWAGEICDDINSAIRDAKKNSSSRPGTLSRQKQRREMEGIGIDIIPPPPANPPPAVPVSNSVKKRLDNLRKTQVISRLMNPAEQSYGADAMDYESVFEYRVDRNVQILNHCLDDIEVFIAKLQKASQASAEMNERRKRTKSGRSSSASTSTYGEGIYTIRSKPPKKEDYIDTLAKIKFCFILLGELQGHINNPSSTDLAHFLFKPLNIIVQSCRGPELAQTVLTPLHTEKALKQLRETMSATEAELFFSLGERWTKSRESWPNPADVVDYNPTFISGWIMPPNNPPPTEHPIALLEQQFPDQKEEQKVRVLKDFTARDEMELSVRADEILVVLDDSRKWWHCRNEQGQVGYVPSNLLMKPQTPRKNSFISSDDGHSSISLGEDMHSSSLSALAVHQYHQRQKSDLSSPRPISEPTPPPPHNPPPMAPPPPPMAAPAPPGPPPLSMAAIVAAKATMDKKRQAPQRQPSQRMEMTDTFKKELSRRVVNSGSRDFVLPAKPKKMPNASISKRSTPNQVKGWLKAVPFWF